MKTPIEKLIEMVQQRQSDDNVQPFMWHGQIIELAESLLREEKNRMKIGGVQNELDYERALIVDKKLRILSKENPDLKSIRKKLRDLIEQYENENWSSDN